MMVHWYGWLTRRSTALGNGKSASPDFSARLTLAAGQRLTRDAAVARRASLALRVA